jgi:hypothetical protein
VRAWRRWRWRWVGRWMGRSRTGCVGWYLSRRRQMLGVDVDDGDVDKSMFETHAVVI